MRLHYHPLSSYSRKVRSAMLHRGDAHDTKTIDVFRGELRTPEYQTLSPFAKMPVLVTDHETLFESTSIIEWLEERGPRVLIPAGNERVARQFDRLGDLYILAPVSALWWREKSDEGQKAPDTIRRAWAVFEKPLAQSPFVAGESLTLGDLSAAIGTDYAVRLGVEPSSTIRAWMERCFAVPAVRQSLDEAMPFIAPGLAMRHGD